jgi:hypothetical protein
MNPRSDEEIIELLRAVEVPEPSPLFWDHLSRRVHEAVAAEPVPSTNWFGRLAWAGGIAAVTAVAAFGLSVWAPSPVTGPAAGPPVAAASGAATSVVQPETPAFADDAAWTAMGELISEMDIEAAGAAGLTVAPGDADDAFDQLSGDEQQRAVELLRQEIRNPTSL